MNRRRLLSLAGGAAAALYGYSRNILRAVGEERKPSANRQSSVSMILLHTNDLHGHLRGWRGWQDEFKGKTVGGVSRLATAIKQVRQNDSENVLLLDAGDLIGDTMIADLTEGSALIGVFNHLGYDAMTFGNHEPDFGISALRERIDQATFPFIAANLITKDTEQSFVKPYLIKRVGNTAVGILGLAYPKTPWTTAAKNVTEVVFQEPVAAVERELPKMREAGAELIVVLSHLGLSADERLAKSVSGIDVIVGGHSHNRTEQAERIGQTLIIQAGAHGSDLGRLDLTIQDGKITAHRHSLITLDHAVIAADEATEKLVGELEESHAKELGKQIGIAGGWLIRAQTIAGQKARKRDEESPVDSLFADIIRSELKAELAFLPGVGYGVAIPEGPITASQLRQLAPHDGKLVSMRLSGKQVLEILEQAVENTFTEDVQAKVGGMIQISGLRFRYDSRAKKGSRVVHVECTDCEWELTKHYRVGTNTMLSKGGHNQQTFLQGKQIQEYGRQYETLAAWFAEHSPIVTPPPGRIAAV